MTVPSFFSGIGAPSDPAMVKVNVAAETVLPLSTVFLKKAVASVGTVTLELVTVTW